MKRYFLCFMALVFFSSCETIVKVDLDDGEKKLVVASYLDFSNTSDKGYARVYLTESSPFYNTNSPKAISDATVLINDTYLLEEQSDSIGYYVSIDSIPYMEEEEFRIDIIAEIDGEEGHWMAINKFTTVPKIDSVYYVYEPAEPPFQDEGYYVKVMITDPAEEENFYHLSVMVNDTSILELNQGTKRSTILKDEYVNGMDLDFIVNDLPLKNGDHMRLTLSSITEDIYYYYFNLYTLLTETSDIGAAPPFPVVGNVISLDDHFDNALGNFQVRSIEVKEIIISD